MKILYLGYGLGESLSRYDTGEYPSHWLYGVVELKKMGHDVSFLRLPTGICKGQWMMIKSMLTMEYDAVIIPYAYRSKFFWWAILRKLGFLRKPVVAISHTALVLGHTKLSKLFNSLIYNAFDNIFFHSPLNLEESKSMNCVPENRFKLLHWGVDLDYYNNKLALTNKKYFISTGREGRDFTTLIDAFKKNTEQLHLYTNAVNYGVDYTWIKKDAEHASNIKVELVENTKEAALRAIQLVANSYCVVIPIKNTDIHYCVGHTSIVEALALGKPILVTKNPYHPIDVEKEGIGIAIEAGDVDGWAKSIAFLSSNQEVAIEMGRKARLLAEDIYNIKNCTLELYQACLKLQNK